MMLHLSLKVLLVVSMLVQSTAFGQLLHPVCNDVTSVSPSGIAMGERSTVSVTVRGSTVAQKQALPQSLVFVLDMSSSMDGPAVNDLRAAVHSILKKLRRGTDMASIVVFRDKAKKSGTLTDDFAALERFIDGENADGGTNFVAGLKEANPVLKSGATVARTAILMSDGQHFGKPSDVADLVRNLSKDGIVYHTVGMGPYVDDGLLKEIARLTGGTYLYAKNSSALAKQFESVYQTTTLSPMHVVVRESVTPDFKVWKDSLTISDAGTNSLPEFMAKVDAMRRDFELTGEITFPQIDFLPDGKSFSFTYEVVSRDCKPKDELTLLRHPRNATITYRDGSLSGKRQALSKVEITKLKCGVRLKKIWKEDERRLEIALHNSFHDPLRDVEIKDVVNGSVFQIDRGLPMTTGSTIAIAPARETISWQTDSIAAAEQDVWTYAIEDLLPLGTPADSFDIELNDAWCKWKIDILQFEITQKKPAYIDFGKDVNSGTLSASVRSEFVRAMPAGAFSTTATVKAASASQAKRGFKYEITFPQVVPNVPLQWITKPTTGGVSHGPTTRHECFTGTFYVKELGDRFEFFAELEAQEILEHLKTSKFYVPNLK